MSLPLLTINSQPIHLLASTRMQQSYGRVPGGETVLRLGDGAAVKQSVWRKRTTTISAAGRMPPALEAIDWTASVTIGCVALVAIRSATTTIALPAARRTDAGPFGFAMLPGGILVKTSIEVTDHVATLGAVAGALAYFAHYYPVLTCHSPGPDQRTDATGTAVGWELAAEEV